MALPPSDIPAPLRSHVAWAESQGLVPAGFPDGLVRLACWLSWVRVLVRSSGSNGLGLQIHLCYKPPTCGILGR